MDEPRSNPEHARSFDHVVDAYDSGRPSYPLEAARWLIGRRPATVLELGAGTGKLTEQLVTLGHTVTATDPSEPMLRRLSERVPGARPVLAAAEDIPARSRSVDVVVAAQSFHWFDHARVLPEVARVLKPRGTLALAWNVRDDRIPWVRRLAAIIGDTGHDPLGTDPTRLLDDSGLFETVEKSTFRFWQPTSRQSLQGLATSRSNLAVLSELEREPVLRKVDTLYEEYGRGHDGMLMPYVTHTYRAAVLPWAHREEALPEAPVDEMSSDSLFIDFR